MPHSAAATVRLAPIIKTNHAQALALDMHMIQQLHHDPDDEQQQQQQQQQSTSAAAVPGGAAAGQQPTLPSGGQPLKVFRSLNSGQSVHPSTAYSSPQLSQRAPFALSSSSPALPRRTSADIHSQSATVSASPLSGLRIIPSHVGPHPARLYTFPNSPHASDGSDAQQQQQTQQQHSADSDNQTDVDGASESAIAPLSSTVSSSSALPPSAPLHIAVSSSAASDTVATDSLLSPGPLYPSLSCSSLSPARSSHAALNSPVSQRFEHFAPLATSPLLSPTAAQADIDGTAAAAAPPSPFTQSVDAGRALSFADSDASGTSSHSSGDVPAALCVSGLPLLYPAGSSPTASTSLAAPLVVPVSGLTARKQCKISNSAPSGQSLLRHCLPCLPVSSASGGSSSSAATRSAAAYRRQSRQLRQSRRRRANGDDGCCSNLVTCSPFRLSFRLTLVLLCILQVVVSVGIVWYLGYSNSESLIGTLSSQLRETALVEITGQVHDQMVRPMRAVNQLQYSYGRSQPNLSDLTYGVRNSTGLFADLSFVVFNFPEISGAGCSTRHNIFVAAINISAYLAAGASPAATNGVTSGFAYALQTYNNSMAVYHYPPQPSPNTNPNWPVPDFNQTSTVAQLGQMWYTVNPFVPSQRPQYVAAAAAKGAFAWSPVYQLAAATNSSVARSAQQNQSLIAAAKAYMTPDGSVGYVCFASVFLSRLGDLLRSLSVSYGPNGLALITDRHGVPLASSDNALMLYTSKKPTWSLSQFPDQRLQAIAEPLAANDVFLPPNHTSPASPTGDFQYGGVFYQNAPAFSAVPIAYGGSAYHLQATVLNSTGLDWIIVVVTKDTDFDGDISHHELVVGLLSMMVLLVAMFCMIAVTQCLNRPLTLVVRYMSAVSQMGKQQKAGHGSGNSSGGSELSGPPHTLSRSAEQLRQLKNIYAEWKQAVTIHMDDRDLEVSRVGYSSRSVAKDGSRGRESRSGNAGQAAVQGSYASPQSGESANSTSQSDAATTSAAAAGAASRRSAWWTRLIDRSAVCLMREVEDMQLTFHSMLHQLTKSTQELEEANDAKRHFVRYIFHEVRVPLNAVMLGLADLRSSCGAPGLASEWTDEQRDVLDIVHEQSQVVGRILNDVLSLHKIEDGALTLQYSPFSLESMILSTMQSFQPGIHDKQIHYTAQLQTVQQFVFAEASAEDLQRLPHIDVVGDKYRLRQVLANFLSNAIKFTPTLGNVHVSLAILPVSPAQTTHALRDGAVKPSMHASPSALIGAGSSASPASRHHAIDMPTTAPSEPATSLHAAAVLGASVSWPGGVPSAATFRISVRDTGVGVSEADQKKLFSPYMQILPGELQKGAGTGLGLSISQNLIRIHGGQIGYAVPDDGRGSEFYMEVPMEMLYRQPAHAGPLGHSSTPNTSLRLVDGSDSKDGSATPGGSAEDGQDGGVAAALGSNSSDLDDENDDEAIGALPAAEDRQEEDAFIREIADLQLQQHSSRARLSHSDDHSAAHSALEAPLSSSSSSSSSFSSASSLASGAVSHSANPLYVSRPALASPDSSMRVLAQQRMHAQHLRQAAPTAIAAAVLSPSLHHSSRRLFALARQPTAPQPHDGGTTPSSAHNEDSVVSSGAASVSSRSVSLVMNDAHGPAASPLLYKRSPITLTRRVQQLASNSSSSPVSGAVGTGGSPFAPSFLSLPASGADETVDGGHVALDDASTPSSHSSQPSLLIGHMQRRGLGVLSDGLSPAAVRSSSGPIASVISTPPSAGSSTSAGSSNHGSPSGRSDVYITLATYGVATKAQRTTNAGSGISSRARDALSALAAAEAAHAVAPLHSPQLQLTSRAANVSSDPLGSSSSSTASTASTTVGPGSSSNGSISATSTSMDGCETRSTPSSSNSTSASTGAAEHSHAATAQPALSAPHAQLANHTSPSAAGGASADDNAAGAQQLQLATSAADASVSTAPLQPLPAPAAVPAAAVAVTVSSPPPPSLRVLVAEDSVPNLKLLLVLLRKCKVDAVGVENGQLAVDAFAAYALALRTVTAGQQPPSPPFDVVLMDGNMPKLSGIEATRQLRALGVAIPIYAVTGNAMAEDTAEFLRAGANHPILTKPVQQKELHRLLQLHAAEVRKAWRTKQQQQQRQQQPL